MEIRSQYLWTCGTRHDEDEGENDGGHRGDGLCEESERNLRDGGDMVIAIEKRVCRVDTAGQSCRCREKSFGRRRL